MDERKALGKTNPELAVNRARNHWKQVGRSEKWIEQRMRGQETRNKLTDYWKDSEVKEGFEYAKLLAGKLAGIKGEPAIIKEPIRPLEQLFEILSNAFNFNIGSRYAI